MNATATATPDTGRWTPRRIAVWTAVALLGAVAWGILALARGESVNAVWLIVAALCSYAIAYRFYARFIATRVLGVDDGRATPAERLDNDQDFQPTDRRVLFGHHFAAIAGAGPLEHGACCPPEAAGNHSPEGRSDNQRNATWGRHSTCPPTICYAAGRTGSRLAFGTESSLSLAVGARTDRR